MSVRTFTVLEANNVALGTLGFINTTGLATASDSGDYVYSALVSDTDATYTAISATGDNLDSQARLAGSIRLGRFESVTVTSGNVLAYLSPKAGV